MVLVSALAQWTYIMASAGGLGSVSHLDFGFAVHVSIDSLRPYRWRWRAAPRRGPDAIADLE